MMSVGVFFTFRGIFAGGVIKEGSMDEHYMGVFSECKEKIFFTPHHPPRKTPPNMMLANERCTKNAQALAPISGHDPLRYLLSILDIHPIHIIGSANKSICFLDMSRLTNHPVIQIRRN